MYSGVQLGHRVCGEGKEAEDGGAGGGGREAATCRPLTDRPLTFSGSQIGVFGGF